MKNLVLKYEQFSDALRQLKKAYQIKETEIVRDGTIQRFEFTFELAWKLLKEINLFYGVETYSPREAIKQAFQLKILSENKKWFEVLEDRNLASHTYSSSIAKQIYRDVKGFIFLFEELEKKAKSILKSK